MHMTREEIKNWRDFVRHELLNDAERRAYPNATTLLDLYRGKKHGWVTRPENADTVVIVDYPMTCCGRHLMTISGRCASLACSHSIVNDPPALEAAE